MGLIDKINVLWYTVKRNPVKATGIAIATLVYAAYLLYQGLKHGDTSSVSHVQNSISDVHENAKTLWVLPGTPPADHPECDLLYIGQDTNNNKIADHVITLFTDKVDGHVVESVHDKHDCVKFDQIISPGTEIQSMMDAHPEAQGTQYALENLAAEA